MEKVALKSPWVLRVKTALLKRLESAAKSVTYVFSVPPFRFDPSSATRNRSRTGPAIPAECRVGGERKSNVLNRRASLRFLTVAEGISGSSIRIWIRLQAFDLQHKGFLTLRRVGQYHREA